MMLTLYRIGWIVSWVALMVAAIFTSIYPPSVLRAFALFAVGAGLTIFAAPWVTAD